MPSMPTKQRGTPASCLAPLEVGGRNPCGSQPPGRCIAPTWCTRPMILDVPTPFAIPCQRLSTRRMMPTSSAYLWPMMLIWAPESIKACRQRRQRVSPEEWASPEDGSHAQLRSLALTGVPFTFMLQ